MARYFYDLIKGHAERTPNKPAIVDGDSTLSYRQLLERVEQFSGGLGGLDLSAESKLGILCLNQTENLIAIFGALLKGIPFIPLNPLLTPDDLVFIVRDANIDMLLVDGVFVKKETAPFFQLFKNKILAGACADPCLLGDNVIEFENFMRDENRREGLNPHNRAVGIPDVILYTSGTTARPKGVMLEESQFYQNTGAFLDHLALDSEDRCIVALPLFHSFGNIMALTLLRVGGCLILLRQFAPKTILASIAKHKATLLPLVPTIYAFLIDLYARGGYDVSSLRLCISGGASLPEAVLKKVEDILGVTVIEGYGLTETSPVISVNKVSEGSVVGSVGPVLTNVEIKISDDCGSSIEKGEVGEIWVRGPTVMKGYWNNEQETNEILTKDGWLRTGDLGHMDNQNRLFISAGRKKDLIIRAGENISPLAIENTLLNHPEVMESAAVGVPHPRKGEQVKACIVLRQGGSATAGDLKEHCRKNLPAFMVPDIVKLYEALPKTATGKVLKSQLREE